MHTLENHLWLLDPYSQYLQWFEGQGEDGQRTLPLFYRNVLGCVRYLLRQIAYRDDLGYAPGHEYDSTGQRIYAKCIRRIGGATSRYSNPSASAGTFSD